MWFKSQTRSVMLHINLTLGVSSNKKIIELYIPLYSFIFLYESSIHWKKLNTSYHWMFSLDQSQFFQVFFPMIRRKGLIDSSWKGESISVCSKLIQRNFKIQQHLIMAYCYKRESIKVFQLDEYLLQIWRTVICGGS